MTAAKEAKRLGLKSLNQACDMTGENRDYFRRLLINKPIIFEAVMIGLAGKANAN